MNIEKRILNQNPCYKAGRTIQPKGIMVHSLGVAQPDPEVFARLWNQQKATVCVHAIVGADKVLQFLPWNHRAWHCGKGPHGSGNDTHISFEMCEPAGHTYQGGMMVGYDVAKNADFFNRVYCNAVELAANLCQMYKLDPMTQIICHCEGNRLGIASNHSDVLHWFPKHGKNMDTFRQDVAAKMKGENDMPITEEEVQAIVAREVAKALAAQDTIKHEANMKVSQQAEKAWDKYTKLGIYDGTRPGAPLTREEDAIIRQRSEPPVWDKLEDVPDWGKPTVKKLMDRGFLQGGGDGLALTHDMLSVYVAHDRAGLYDRK